jgi:hypothetical protein
LLAPLIAVAGKENAIVQPERALLPELDPFGFEPEAGPVRRPRHRALRERGVAPVSVGRSIVATWEPHQTAVLSAIHDLGLELQVIFNKGAVMVLPAGVNKATGLDVALAELHLSPHSVVGVGDAENDHAFLARCECAVAVSNALPLLKERADFVTGADHGAGVEELITELLDNDLCDREPRLARHQVLLGRRPEGRDNPRPRRPFVS